MRKRGAPPLATPSSQLNQQVVIEEEELDEDVFLEETLLHYEEEETHRRAVAERFAKWKRPVISQSYLSQSQNIVSQQLEIDYVIGDNHKELLPNYYGPAAILRIFGVPKKALII